MNKRAEFTLLQIGTLLAGLFAATILVLVIMKMGSKEAIYQSFIVEDGALLADTLQAVPQNARVGYSSVYVASNYTYSANLDYANLGANFLGVGPRDPDTDTYLFMASFNPSGFVRAIRSTSSTPVFFLIKERDILFMSSSPDYKLAEVSDRVE